MAASVNQNYPTAQEPYIERELVLSSLVSDDLENIAHGGPSGATVSRATMEVLVRPTDGGPVYFEHKAGSDSTTNSTVAVRFYTAPGGSLDGAKVLLRLQFRAAAAGGITAS